MNTDAPTPTPTFEEPEGALLHGVFALYNTPTGGIHLVWRGDSEGEMHHVEVPAFAVKMAQAQMNGESGGLMGKLMSRIGGAR